VTAPLVSIGMPTHNGAAYIGVALEALLAQDHRAIEIVVSDNASTDRTPEIVADVIRRDHRVRYERSDHLVSAPHNFNRVFALTNGPYYMWAADDDLWDPSYVRRLLAALEADPAAVMASSGVRFIDPDGNPLETDLGRYDNPDLSSRSVTRRVHRLLRRGGWYQVYGLARRTALERTELFQDRYGPDVVLVMELALLGPIAHVPDPLFRYRRFPDRTEGSRVAKQGGDANRPGLVDTRMSHLQESLSATVGRARLPASTKLRLQADILRAAYLEATPMHERIRRETAARARLALHERDVARIVKFGLADAIERSRSLPRTAADLARRGRRAGGRVRRRIG
jgi:glycosyltransferase involved in cell wall biosynthesis